MLETGRYARKPFEVDAVQVTKENMEEIATWCQGDIREDEQSIKYVKVRVQRPLNERQTRAYVGDWVLYAGTGYKVYPHKAFMKSFERAGGVQLSSTPTPMDLAVQVAAKGIAEEQEEFAKSQAEAESSTA